MKSNGKYIDSIIVPVPKKNMKTYKKWAKLCSKIWREHGALEYVECIADDVKKGKVTSFPRSVKLKTGETVVLSFIVYKSRTHRDRVMLKVMNDPRLAEMMDPDKMIFDGMRMYWGGFKPFLKA